MSLHNLSFKSNQFVSSVQAWQHQRTSTLCRSLEKPDHCMLWSTATPFCATCPLPALTRTSLLHHKFESTPVWLPPPFPHPPIRCLGIAESAQILALSTNSKGILKDFLSFLLPFLLTEGIWPAHRQPLLEQISLHSGSKPHRPHSAQGCLLKLLP